MYMLFFPDHNVSNTFVTVLVKFRFVVFRPFIDEILTGRIRSCNHEGVQGITNNNFCIVINQSVFYWNVDYFPEHNNCFSIENWVLILSL